MDSEIQFFKDPLTALSENERLFSSHNTIESQFLIYWTIRLFVETQKNTTDMICLVDTMCNFLKYSLAQKKNCDSVTVLFKKYVHVFIKRLETKIGRYHKRDDEEI